MQCALSSMPFSFVIWGRFFSLRRLTPKLFCLIKYFFHQSKILESRPITISSEECTMYLQYQFSQQQLSSAIATLVPTGKPTLCLSYTTRNWLIKSMLLTIWQLIRYIFFFSVVIFLVMCHPGRWFYFHCQGNRCCPNNSIFISLFVFTFT